MTPPAEKARGLLREARSIFVLTGAGISAESGVPTFRGPGGLWRQHRPEDLATPEAFRRDPRLVWEWYAWRRSVVAGCSVNAGHRALARRALAGGLDLITQNVDGLHSRAAIEEAEGREPSPAMPVELHGALFRDRCTGCGRRTPAAESGAPNRDDLPRCATCGSLLRPDVVWFGEGLDERVLGQAFEQASQADVCLAVGTSAVVHPAASLPLATLQHGGILIEVNPEPTPLTPRATVSVAGPAAEWLPILLAQGPLRRHAAAAGG